MTLVHPTAEVSSEAILGEGTRVWHQAQVREGARIGRNCIVGKGVYVDFHVTIGDNVKIQNGCYVYHGATLEDGVFLGPGVILTNDKHPRAINPDGSLKTDSDWVVGQILVKRGASLGAGAIVLPSVTVGAFAMVGAGSVVARDVPEHGLVYGNPARLAGFVCSCGEKLKRAAGEATRTRESVPMICPACRAEVLISETDYARLAKSGVKL
jgi:UDP-2-acetamido-3-amino-2,3-dideoxy-glucuronate N-acetyltransferase